MNSENKLSQSALFQMAKLSQDNEEPPLTNSKYSSMGNYRRNLAKVNKGKHIEDAGFGESHDREVFKSQAVIQQEKDLEELKQQNILKKLFVNRYRRQKEHV